MAPRGRQRSESQRGEGKRSSGDRRTAILALLLLAASLLIFLALVSYDAADEANADIHATDLLKVFTGDTAARAKADTAHNWLGLTGAILSDFLIKSTIGYAVFVVPVLMFFWGWVILRKLETRPAVVITNTTLIGSLLVSASFGMLRLILGEDSPGMEWSGVIGDFLASILAQLLGKAGGAIVLLVGILVTLVLAVDLDLHQTVERLRRLWLQFLDWLGRKREERVERRERGKGNEDLAVLDQPGPHRAPGRRRGRGPAGAGEDCLREEGSVSSGSTGGVDAADRGEAPCPRDAGPRGTRGVAAGG
jgi:hypothetical protein